MKYIIAIIIKNGIDSLLELIIIIPFIYFEYLGSFGILTSKKRFYKNPCDVSSVRKKI